MPLSQVTWPTTRPDLDKLVLDVETDGTVDAVDAYYEKALAITLAAGAHMLFVDHDQNTVMITNLDKKLHFPNLSDSEEKRFGKIVNIT